jgi:hypothetical protein
VTGIVRAQSELDRLLDAVGALNVDETHHVVLRTIGRVEEDAATVETLRAFEQSLPDPRLSLVVRGGEEGLRVFAYRADAAPPGPPFGAFLWVPVHSGLVAWWLLTSWRVRQLTDASIELLRSGQVIAAAACARSLLETAAAARYDTRRLMDYWSECRRFAPTLGRPVPTTAYRALHDYLLEMMFGGKFKGDLPDDWAALFEAPFSRVNVQTCLDHLARDLPDTRHWYDSLCNAVHPSVASTVVFMDRVEDPAWGETRVWFNAAGLGRSISGAGEGSTVRAIISSSAAALEVATEALDAGLRQIDDICLTTRIGDYRTASHWRCVQRPSRNDSCPCRSGRKAKHCSHEWGTDDIEASEAAERDGRQGARAKS